MSISKLSSLFLCISAASCLVFCQLYCTHSRSRDPMHIQNINGIALCFVLYDKLIVIIADSINTRRIVRKGAEIVVRDKGHSRYNPLQRVFILATCALQSSTSVGTARIDASRIPDESEKPNEPILNSSSCFDRSMSTTVDGSGRSWLIR